MLWAVSMFFLVLFQCHPIEDAWILLAPHRKCIGLYTQAVAVLVPNIVTSAIIFIMPMPYIFRLNMRLSQKTALACVFLLGGFDISVSIIRFVLILQLDYSNPDFTWYLNSSVIWTSVEINVGIICACLPSIRPILNFLRTGTLFPSSVSSSNPPSSTPRRQSSKLNSLRWRLFGKGKEASETDGTISLVRIKSEFENTSPEHGRFSRTSPQHIEVRKDWSVQYDHAS